MVVRGDGLAPINREGRMPPTARDLDQGGVILTGTKTKQRCLDPRINRGPSDVKTDGDAKSQS